MPDDDLNFGQLCDRLDRSEKTVRKLVREENVKPRRDGSSTKYTLRQVRALEAALKRRPATKRGRPARARNRGFAP